MINAKTRLAAVLAKPIKHSLSPFIHNKGFELIHENGAYLAFEIEAQQLEKSLQMIKEWDMYGVNLSMPFKEVAIEYMDTLSEEVKLIGAMNTVVHQNGQLIGYNTDGYGFVASLKEQQVSLKNKKISIFGAGGAAKAIIAQLALREEVTEICVMKRTNGKSDEIRTYLEKITNATQVVTQLIPLEDDGKVREILASSDIVVNATNVGMKETESESVIHKRNLHKNLVVVDIIYHPNETRLLKEAKELGCHTINGLGMLVHQAAQSFHLWTGKEMPTKIIQEQLRKQFEEK